mmetsp:Transcript_7793/g.15472  ORF Transcript_7793/g.15472 Transcript_7793/m.15472 type:complete len:304 (-) Transcript_7793:172-1083(-)
MVELADCVQNVHRRNTNTKRKVLKKKKIMDTPPPPPPPPSAPSATEQLLAFMQQQFNQHQNQNLLQGASTQSDQAIQLTAPMQKTIVPSSASQFPITTPTQANSISEDFPNLQDLSKLNREKLEHLCTRLCANYTAETPDRDLIATIALRGPYGQAGKMYAIRQVREWVQSVDYILREIGVVRKEGPAVMDLLDAKFSAMKQKRKRASRELSISSSTSDDLSSDATESDADGAKQLSSNTSPRSIAKRRHVESYPPVQALPTQSMLSSLPLPDFLQNAIHMQITPSPLAVPWLQTLQHQQQLH